MRLLSSGSRYFRRVLFVLVLLALPISSTSQNRITNVSDINGDGRMDLLWYNPSTGQSAAWLMDGASSLSGAYLPVSSNWRIAATADFNGDGMADLLWYDTSNGQFTQWLMNGFTISKSTLILSDPNWKIVEAADFNGDGMADLLLYNASSGQTVEWLMNGSSVSISTLLLTNATWKVVATADFNGDGKADLLWSEASTGQTAIWLMNGTTALSGTMLGTDPNWKVTAIADFNGDRMADVLWYNSATGETAIWLMYGSTWTARTTLLTDSNWRVSGTGDLNGDGRADLLWNNTVSGQTSVWLMNGTTVLSSAILFTDPNWKINAIADLNKDGKADLIWYNAATGQTASWLMNGTTVASGANLLTNPTWRLACIKISSLTAMLACDDAMTNASLGNVALPSNLVPLVNAGPDSTVALSSTANLSGTATDDGIPIRLLISSWTQVSGPGAVTFGNAASASTTAAFSLAGTYTLRLSATDSALSASDDVVITVNGGVPVNIAPVVNAGIDQTITLPASASLAGSATDDGLPTGSTLSRSWSKVSGPGTVTFGNASLASTTAALSLAGTYTLRLTATDGALSTSDDIVITVNPIAPVNTAPAVNAGLDQIITLPASASLAGSATDDGLPTGSTLSRSWSKVSGPGTVTFGNASLASTTAALSLAGTYTLRLTATDGALSTSDDIVIIVNPIAPVNIAPVVNAGPDQTITVPASASLAGSATDDGLPTGSTLTKTWSKVSGPGTVTFANASSLNTTATFSVAGTYTLKLTASDSLLSTSDNAVFVVNATLPVNQTPVVSAAPDQTITLPASATLAGTATDDGLPTGSILTKTWSKISGPGTAAFANASSLNSTATFSLAGSYTLRLTASDGTLTSSDDMVVIVNPCGNVVSGTISVLANASDNVGVASVQMKIDGVNLGSIITVAPYSRPWITTTATNGCHLLSVVALDAAGNQGNASVWAMVNNP